MEGTRQAQNVRAARSLRTSMVLWTVAIALVIQLTMALVITIYQRSSLDAFFSERLVRRAETLAAEIREGTPRLDPVSVVTTLGARTRIMMSDHVASAVFTPAGSLLGGLPEKNAILPPIDLAQVTPGSPFVERRVAPEFATAAEPDPEMRIAVVRASTSTGEPFVLMVVSSDNQFEAMMRLVYRVFGFAIPVGVAAAGVAGWLIGGLAVAPLASLRRIAGSLLDDVAEAESTGGLPPEVASLERDLQEVRVRLRDALLVQDRFISNVSHELKTPISVLLTEAQTVNLEELPPEGKRFVQSVTDEMRRLGRMIHSFLTLTRLRGGKALENVQTCHINEIVMDAVQGCGPMARQYHVRLMPHLAEDDRHMIVRGESELLRVMVDNLVRNAIRFSPENREVTVRVVGDPGHCAILVRDFGPGVPEELLDKVFHRFVQAPSESSRGRGHGLGLSIAQGIAELHGGSISVRNSPSGGCEFAVRLPVEGASGVEGAVAGDAKAPEDKAISAAG